jgi:integral membrane protein
MMGTIEGISTLVLFGVAMPLKYAAGMPMAVRIAGSIHGLLFVILAVMFVLAIKKVPIPGRMAALGIVAAVVPFGPFVMDRKLGRL